MNDGSIFCVLTSARMAVLIREAKRHVLYVAPGIQDEPAKALASLLAHSPTLAVTVSIDFDERTLRMGYGTLSAVEGLRAADIRVSQAIGFRSAVLIVDDNGWVFSPTALYLEPEPQTDETPNALRLTVAQVRELLIRLSPEAKRKAVVDAETPEEAARIEAIPLEGSQEPITKHQFDVVSEAIKLRHL